MTCPEIEEAVLKVDARGRIRITPERRARILEEYERSGVSARQFAKMAGLNPKTFSSWVLNLRRQKEVEKQGWVGCVKPMALLEAVVEERGSGLMGGEQRVVVELGGGSRVEVSLRGQLPLVAELVGLIAERNAHGKRGC